MKNDTDNTAGSDCPSSDLFSLSWDEQHDDNDNSIYEAASPYHDDGSPFHFRICQRLRDNKHEFVEDSDPELMMDEDDPRTWATLAAAKAAMQTDANDIVKSHRENAMGEARADSASPLHNSVL